MRNPLSAPWRALRVAVRDRLRRLLSALGRGLRFVVSDRHDALTYTGLASLTTGVALEFDRSWALIVLGAVLLLFAWKGLR